MYQMSVSNSPDRQQHIPNARVPTGSIAPGVDVLHLLIKKFLPFGSYIIRHISALCPRHIFFFNIILHTALLLRKFETPTGDRSIGFASRCDEEHNLGWDPACKDCA
jgi:hypothetical protein